MLLKEKYIQASICKLNVYLASVLWNIVLAYTVLALGWFISFDMKNNVMVNMLMSVLPYMQFFDNHTVSYISCRLFHHLTHLFYSCVVFHNLFNHALGDGSLVCFLFLNYRYGSRASSQVCISSYQMQHSRGCCIQEKILEVNAIHRKIRFQTMKKWK